MTLSSGAHIKLGDYEFKLDKSVDNHYLHRYYDLTAEKVQIAGTSGKEQLLPDSLWWSMDDWAGGEGNNIFYQDEYDTYYGSGALNPRVRGQLTARPDRTRSTGSGFGYGTQANLSAHMFSAIGRVLRFWNSYVQYINNDLGWTDRLSGGAAYSAATGDVNWVYAFNKVNGNLYRRGYSSPEDWVSLAGDSDLDYRGAALLEGKLYGWTGASLWEFDVHDWDNWATDHYRLVYGDDGDIPEGTYDSRWFANCFATENSVVAWRTASGISEVFEFRAGVGRPLWRAPMGFSIRSGCYQNGILYFAGHWGDEGEGWGALYALPLDSLRPIFLKWIGRLFGSKYGVPEISSSYGNQILIASGDRYLYVYDTETDGLTVLDSNASDIYKACLTYGGFRYAIGEDYTYKFDDDEPAEREAGFNYSDFTDLDDATLTSSRWDLDYPMEMKGLVGFYVAMAPMISGQHILVSYCLDGGSWVDLTEIVASTPGASTGRVFVAAPTGASTPQFNALQFRVKLTSDTGVLAPILYSITAESKIARKREEWELIIRLKDEMSRERPSHRQVPGPTLRDWLLSVVTTGQNLVLLDGFRYENDNQYSTHTVTVKEVTDLIDEEGEGICRVILTNAEV